MTMSTEPKRSPCVVLCDRPGGLFYGGSTSHVGGVRTRLGMCRCALCDLKVSQAPPPLLPAVVGALSSPGGFGLRL